MSDFEVFFSLFGLLLGFTLVEVLSGFVRTIKAGSQLHCRDKDPVRLGWLTPMLGLYVILDLTSTWVNLWEIRNSIVFFYDTAFALVAFAAIYYFAASMIFPDRPEDWPDLDEWFWRHRRQVLGAIFLALLFAVPFFAALHPQNGLAVIISNLVIFLLIAGAAIPRRVWIVRASLGLLSAMLFTEVMGNAVARMVT